MVKTFRLGGDLNQEDRANKNMKVFDVLPPAVYYLAKDHKPIPEGSIVPSTRPVCGAKDGPLSRIENFLSLILGFVAENFVGEFIVLIQNICATIFSQVIVTLQQILIQALRQW